jgi:glutamate/aspartate transport system permease protein
MVSTAQWSILWEAPFREWILWGILLTLWISLVSWALALAIGIAIGVMGESPRKGARLFAAAYVEVFRNVPLLIQLFFVYFVVPMLLPTFARTYFYDVGWEAGSAILTLSLYTSAKLAEHFRAGLNAVSDGIRKGALATGLSWWQMQRYVVVPLVLRLIFPSLTTEFLTIFKSSSLAMTVGVAETTYMAQRIGFHTFHWVEANTIGTAVYLLIAWGVALAMGAVEKRMRVPGLIQRERTARA